MKEGMAQTSGLALGRFFTRTGTKAYEQLRWITQDIVFGNPTNSATVTQRDVESPEDWSSDAVRTLLAYNSDLAGRVSSVQVLIDRVVELLGRQGLQGGYFESETESEDFCEELKFVLATQRATFGPGVWRHVAAADQAQELVDGYMPTGSTTVSLADWHMQHEAKLSTTGVVQLSDEFVKAALQDEVWQLEAGDKGTAQTLPARELFHELAEQAWHGQPVTVEFITRANAWYATPNAGRLSVGGPQLNILQLEDSGVLVGSINLLKYVRSDKTIDIEAFCHTITLMLAAQEILLSYGVYSSAATAKNTKAYRPLALGYDNLSALLAAVGLAYDSDEARAVASALSALLTGQAYLTSAKLARRVGPFSGYRKNREAMQRVLRLHQVETPKLSAGLVPEELLNAARSAWDEAVELNEQYGVRNSQVSALPGLSSTTTLLGCLTPGVEPATSLIGPQDYVALTKMIGAVQSYISGAVGPVVRVPQAATIEDIERVYVEAWQGGAKLIAAQRGVAVQPQSAVPSAAAAAPTPALAPAQERPVALPEPKVPEAPSEPVAPEPVIETAQPPVPQVLTPSIRVLPRHRNAKLYDFRVGNLDGFFTVSEYADGTPGELSISVGQPGSVLFALLRNIASLVTHGLQQGMALKAYIGLLSGTTYGPSGLTDDPEIAEAQSVTDYIFHRLALDYLSVEDLATLGLSGQAAAPTQTSLLGDTTTVSAAESARGPLCNVCGNRTQPALPTNGHYQCPVCGTTQ